MAGLCQWQRWLRIIFRGRPWKRLGPQRSESQSICPPAPSRPSSLLLPLPPFPGHPLRSSRPAPPSQPRPPWAPAFLTSPPRCECRPARPPCPFPSSSPSPRLVCTTAVCPPLIHRSDAPRSCSICCIQISLPLPALLPAACRPLLAGPLASFRSCLLPKPSGAVHLLVLGPEGLSFLPLSATCFPTLPPPRPPTPARAYPSREPPLSRAANHLFCFRLQ